MPNGTEERKGDSTDKLVSETYSGYPRLFADCRLVEVELATELNIASHSQIRFMFVHIVGAGPVPMIHPTVNHDTPQAGAIILLLPYDETRVAPVINCLKIVCKASHLRHGFNRRISMADTPHPWFIVRVA